MKRWMYLALLLLFFGCAKPDQHSTTGVVKEIRAGGKELVIDHKEFPGFMEAMTMPYELENTGLAYGLKPGDTIDFTITRRANGYEVTRVQKTK